MDFRFLTIESQQQGVIAFIAVVLFQMLFVVVQWILHRRVDFSYYLVYLLTVVLYAVSLYRHILNIGDIFPFGEWLLEINIYPLPLLSVFFYFRFQRSFLELSIHNPELNLVVYKLERFILTYCIVAPLLVLAGVNGTILYILFVTVACVTIITSLFIVIKFLKKKIPLEQFSIIGAIFIISGSLVTVVLGIQEKQLTPLIVNPHLPLMVCALAELFTFTTGLTYKARIIERAKSETENKLMNKIREKQKLEIDFLQMKNSVSRELHDSLGAELSTARMMLNRIQKNDNERDQKLLGNSINMLSGSISTLYRLMDEMNNFSVAGTDCISDIQQIINLLQPINSVQFRFTHCMEEGKLPGGYNYHIVQITRELINNTLKYADATQVNIDIKCVSNLFEYTYSDNGKGFDYNTLSKGNGLNNIAGRVSECAGKIKIETSAGKGIMVGITIDLAGS